MTIEFGTDGWRAIIAREFTFSNVQKVTKAIAKYVKKHYYINNKKPPVLIGYDTRFMADEFANFAACILTQEGIDVKISVEDIPTPGVAFAASILDTAGAMQFTASHNPPEYCGIKYIPDYGGPATTEITGEITNYLEEINDEPLKQYDTEIAKYDIRTRYLEKLKSMVDIAKIKNHNFKIGYDALFSTSRIFLKQVLDEIGVNVHIIHSTRDPLFGGGMPEPKPQYLQELMKMVKDEKLEMGIATDGDADRFAIINEKGEFITPNQVLCLLSYHLVKNRKMSGSIVRTVATTHLLDKVAAKYNLGLLETPVGFKYVGEAMRKSDVLIGGEESGGLSVKGHIPEKDGLLADLLMLELVAYENKPLSVIWDNLQNELNCHFYQSRTDYKLKNANPKLIMQELKSNPPKTINNMTVQKTDTKDGLKFYLDNDSWLLVRPSGTEPLLRLYSESPSKELSESITSDFGAIVQKLMSSQNLTGAKS